MEPVKLPSRSNVSGCSVVRHMRVACPMMKWPAGGVWQKIAEIEDHPNRLKKKTHRYLHPLNSESRAYLYWLIRPLPGEAHLPICPQSPLLGGPNYALRNPKYSIHTSFTEHFSILSSGSNIREVGPTSSLSLIMQGVHLPDRVSSLSWSYEKYLLWYSEYGKGNILYFEVINYSHIQLRCWRDPDRGETKVN